MDQKIRDHAENLFRSKYEDLTEKERHVAHHITQRTPISTNIVQDYSEQLNFGQKMADKVASLSEMRSRTNLTAGAKSPFSYSNETVWNPLCVLVKCPLLPPLPA